MIYAKKIFNGFKEILPMDATPESYIVMTLNEHENLLQKIADEKKQAKLAKYETDHFQKLHHKYKTQHDSELITKENTISELITEVQSLQQQIAALTTDRNSAIQDACHAIALNENLKRVAKERANADRGLTPKKGHHGYVIHRMEQFTEHYMLQNDYTAWRKENVWKSKDQFIPESPAKSIVWRNVIETPYDSKMSADVVEMEIFTDLTDGGILASWGCSNWQPPHQNGIFRTWTDADGKPSCGAYRYSLICNMKSGFWIIQIYTTLALNTLPEGDNDE